jgi:DNA-binding NarL/FixJ family response regulator
MSAVKRRRFTREEDNLMVALYEQGVRPSEIAARIGVSTSTIETKFRAWGIQRTMRPYTAAMAYGKLDKTLPREDQFAELLSLGFSVPDIGRAMGYGSYRSANAAFQRLRRHMGKQAA